MKKIALVFLVAGLVVSCRQNNQGTATTEEAGERVLVAENIIYDVVIRVPTDGDAWEVEKLQGYRGDEMIKSIFDAVHDGKIEAYEYHSGKKLSPSDIEQMEMVPGFDRRSIGKIQFTENWYFNNSTLAIEKEVKSIVLGYESRDPADGTLIGYKAAFRLDLN